MMNIILIININSVMVYRKEENNRDDEDTNLIERVNQPEYEAVCVDDQFEVLLLNYCFYLLDLRKGIHSHLHILILDLVFDFALSLYI